MKLSPGMDPRQVLTSLCHPAPNKMKEREQHIVH